MCGVIIIIWHDEKETQAVDKDDQVDMSRGS
jgi:hypothetical protein